MACVARYRCGPADCGLGADNLAGAGRYQALALDQRNPPRTLISPRSPTGRTRRRRWRDVVRQADRQRRRRSRVQFSRPSRRSPPAEILVSATMDEKKELVPAGKGDMPARTPYPETRTKIQLLPDDLKSELDRRLSAGTFR